MSAVSPERVRELAAGVEDPELPVLTLGDLGIVRDVRVGDDGVEVDITPTYSGCPAVEVMRDRIVEVLRDNGVPQPSVRTVLSPAWSTDDITDDGRRKLLEFGIAPPGRVQPGRAVLVQLTVRCPQCGSPDTEELSRFGSTACKALRRCRTCREPFDHMKPL